MIIRRKIVLIIVTNVALLLLAVIVGEAVVRKLGLAPLTLTVFESHPTRMFALAPGRDQLFVGQDFTTRVVIGPRGFRVPAGRMEDAPGSPRVLALGDSMTFGYGVEAEESWPAELEKRLRAGGAPNVEVINAGVVGYAPDQELDQLRELLPALKPDLVILALYPGNDLAEVMLHRSAPAMRVSPEGALLENPKPSDLDPGVVRLWLAKNLRLYGYLRVKMHRALVKLELKPRPVIYHPDYFDDALGYTDAYAENWRELEKLVEAMARETEAAGAGFLLALIPMDVQVSETYWTHFRKLGFKLDPKILEEDRPQARLHEFAERTGIPIIDLLAVFRISTRERLYFPNDPHLTPAGQALVAKILRPVAAMMLRPAPATAGADAPG